MIARTNVDQATSHQGGELQKGLLFGTQEWFASELPKRQATTQSNATQSNRRHITLRRTNQIGQIDLVKHLARAV
jgi:hypothetical protein